MSVRTSFTKQERSWMMYDWANSVHSVVVVTILPIFYNSITHNSVDAVSRWGTGTSAAMLIVALLTPFLGVLGDFKNARKRMFTFFLLLGALACAFMAPTPYLAAKAADASGLAALVLVLYIISTIGFAGANISYDAFLPEVTTNERMDRVSILGYGLGYIGGSTIPLLIFLIMNLVGLPMTFCLAFAFGLTAVWWVLFSIPMWKNVKQTHYVEKEKGVLRDSLRMLGKTLREIFRNKVMLVFLIAYFFYIDGVGTIIHMSTIYGSALGIDSTQMLLALLVVQLLGLPFALIYTKLSAKFGPRTMVGVAILIYSGICVFGFFVRSAWQFWLLAVLVSTSQGGIQALSRSLFGKMIPDQRRSGEFFGVYDIFGKFSSIMGPALFGGVTAWVASALMNRQGLTDATVTTDQLSAISKQASPWGVLSVMVLFIIGAVLYFIVLPRMEKKQALSEQ
ncbi:MAG: MFS transporter [Eubacteriales bacterium]|nr:MFS transporter [Eubacteriales bacterium]